MDFLVHINLADVYALSDRERQDVLEREWARGSELHAKGIIRKLWRLPGQKCNVGIWSARDADELHESLQSLPIWPLSTFEVTPLATHPLFAEIKGS
jgi:muconolactone D-isomerase